MLHKMSALVSVVATTGPWHPINNHSIFLDGWCQTNISWSEFIQSKGHWSEIEGM